MGLSAHTIHPAAGSRHRTKRVGRGNASQKGTMSGRGGKGQTARSGGIRRTALRAFRPSLLKIPKLRGFHSLYPKKEVVTLSTLERVAALDTTVTPAYLYRQGVISRPDNGVKIVATGTLTKKVMVEGCFATKQAVVAIEKAGGKLTF